MNLRKKIRNKTCGLCAAVFVPCFLLGLGVLVLGRPAEVEAADTPASGRRPPACGRRCLETDPQREL